MDVEIVQISEDEAEKVLIRCHQIRSEVREIEDFVKSRNGVLEGRLDQRRYSVPIQDILFIESVDGRAYLYVKNKVFENDGRLYELESLLKTKQFCRISRSTIVNLMKIRSIQPALNGRFMLLLETGEKLIISRSYVKAFKKALKGGKEDEGA